MRLTKRVVLEVATHEGVVLEAYKDTKGIWTWSVGITKYAGIDVMKYKDNPATLEECLEAYKKVLKERYAPAVAKAFREPLKESQFAAALSFHYNTGAIGRATWVKNYNAGDMVASRRNFMNWRKPPEIIRRRQKECDLFFDGAWSQTGKVQVWQVRKPAYTPYRPRSIEI